MSNIVRVIALIALLLTTSCMPGETPRLRLATTAWLGYTPLYYARSQGWLEAHNIHLVQVVSRAESMYLFESGNVEAFVGTQYEYSLLLPSIPDLGAVSLFDRSNGGDLILSNVSLEEIRSAPEIDVYLEIDSVNLLLLSDFMRQQDINAERVNYQNADQSIITTLEASELERPTLVVTYNPHHFTLMRQGLRELASTRDNPELLVVDGIFARESAVNADLERFQALNRMIDDAVAVLQQDPRAYFDAIRIYMPGVSYEEFAGSLDTVVWINQTLDPALTQRLRQNVPPVEPLM